MRKYLNLRHIICLGLIFAFLVNTFGPAPLAQAQDFRLPAPGVMVHLSPEYNPPILKGIKVHPDNPFRFDFILDQGDNSLPLVGRVREGELKQESTKLIKYFLASLTIPEKDLWVNLSPYEKDRIVPESFGRTEMGRDLLAEDYMLKQITASLIYPEGETGKIFWKCIYEEAAKKFGTTNIPVNTFNKVWIVPEKAVVYENAKAGTAYVVESKLKVMLEQDYLALSHNVIPAKAGIHDTSTIGNQIIREIVIPELTKEVNEDKNFSQLRQVYDSLILATWYKKKIKDSILAQVYENKKKVAGVNIDDPKETQRIYERYLQAFKKGAYNYIKEEIDPATQQSIPRKYFSGGLFMGDKAMKVALSIKNMPETFETGGNSIEIDAAINAAILKLGPSNAAQTGLPEYSRRGFTLSLLAAVALAVQGCNSQGGFAAKGYETGNLNQGTPIQEASNQEDLTKEYPAKLDPLYGEDASKPNILIFPGVIMGAAPLQEFVDKYKQSHNIFLYDYDTSDSIKHATDKLAEKIKGMQFDAVITYSLGDLYYSYLKFAHPDVLNTPDGKNVLTFRFVPMLSAPLWAVLPGATAASSQARLFRDAGVYLNNPKNRAGSNQNSHVFKVPLDIVQGGGFDLELLGSPEVQGSAEVHPIMSFHIGVTHSTKALQIIDEKMDGLNKSKLQKLISPSEKKPDSAMLNGGIDLSSDKALTVQNNGQGIKFHIDPAQLKELENAPGFVPVIISIKPMTNIRFFLGLNSAIPLTIRT